MVGRSAAGEGGHDAIKAPSGPADNNPKGGLQKPGSARSCSSRLRTRRGEGASGVKSRFVTGHRNQKGLRKFERCWVAIYRSASMCDYSLHAVTTRPAEVAETLVSTKFQTAGTRGFASPNNPKVAVCLRPGTELAFEHDVQTGGMMFRKSI